LFSEPDFRVTVTGPVASDHLMVKGSPASMPLKLSLVKITLALARVARKRVAMKDFILVSVLW
jgi:hypothetical protein